MNYLKKSFIVCMCLLTIIFSQTFNEYLDQVYSESNVTESINIDSCKNELVSMLNLFRIEIYREKETQSLYNQFGFLEKMVLIKLDNNVDSINFIIDEFNYPSYIFPKLFINGRKVKVMLNIKNCVLNSYPNMNNWENSKNSYINYIGPNEYATHTVVFQNTLGHNENEIKIVRMDYLYNITATQEVWSHPVLYNVGDFVIHRNKVYRCVIRHTSQVNLMPGEPGIWLWTYISDVKPDYFHITFYNFQNP